MKTITFEGLVSGDHECFCWDVTKETFQEICQLKPGLYTKSYFNKKLFRLYPSEVFNNLIEINPQKKYKFKISVEEIL